MKNIGVFLSLIIATFLCGCATNTYKDFYTSNQTGFSYLTPPKKQVPQMTEIQDFSQVSEWEAKGYCVLGTSSFQGKYIPRARAIDVAKEIGASVILFKLDNYSVEECHTTIVVPTTQTSYHHGTIYSPQGGNISYSGTTITHGTTTCELQELVASATQTAIFLAPLKNIPEAGVDFDKLPNVPGQQDTPVRIRVVYEGSLPAQQGIRPGAILRKINGEDIPNHQALDAFLYSGKTIESMEVDYAE